MTERLTAQEAYVPLRVSPITVEAANTYIGRWHRHNKPRLAKFAVAVVDDSDAVRGVALIGRPVAPALDDGKAIEILRVATDGTPNACSMLYGAARRAAKAMGHDPVITYSLPEEGGASLRAAGFTLDKADAGGKAAMWHNRPGRTVLQGLRYFAAFPKKSRGNYKRLVLRRCRSRWAMT